MIYFWFLLGTVVGSFLNVCIYRLPRGESVIAPPSHCPHCGRELSAVELIPIISFIIQRGRCRQCRQKISLRYPIVELLCGILFVLSWSWSKGDLISTIFAGLFSASLLLITFVDLEHQVVPDAVVIFGTVSSLLFHLIKGSWLSSISGAAAGFSLLYLIGWVGRLWFKKVVLGEGDWYIAMLAGAFLGLGKIWPMILLSYLLAALVAVFLLLTGRVKLGQYVPFGPALAAGGLVTLYWGDKILAWYWNLFQ